MIVLHFFLITVVCCSVNFLLAEAFQFLLKKFVGLFLNSAFFFIATCPVLQVVYNHMPIFQSKSNVMTVSVSSEKNSYISRFFFYIFSLHSAIKFPALPFQMLMFGSSIGLVAESVAETFSDDRCPLTLGSV